MKMMMSIMKMMMMMMMKVPLDWQHANVTPISKTRDRSHPDNYRPISLTSVESKLIETIICENMMKIK